MNTLIAENPEIAGKAYFQIDDNTITVKGGLPLDNFPGFSGRYLNGTYSFNVKFNEGKLEAYVESFLLDKKNISRKLKQDLLEDIRQKDFSEDILRDEKVRRFMQNIKNFKVENDRIVISR